MSSLGGGRSFHTSTIQFCFGGLFWMRILPFILRLWFFIHFKRSCFISSFLVASLEFEISLKIVQPFAEILDGLSVPIFTENIKLLEQRRSNKSSVCFAIDEHCVKANSLFDPIRWRRPDNRRISNFIKRFARMCHCHICHKMKWSSPRRGALRPRCSNRLNHCAASVRLLFVQMVDSLI